MIYMIFSNGHIYESKAGQPLKHFVQEIVASERDESDRACNFDIELFTVHNDKFDWEKQLSKTAVSEIVNYVNARI